MTTLREAFREELEDLHRIESNFELISNKYPELLDLEGDSVSISTVTGSITFNNNKETHNGLAARVASILGTDQNKRKRFLSGVNLSNVTYWIPRDDDKYAIMLDVYQELGNGNCKKYKVVEEKEIEICGELDESKYLTVEELE